MNISDQGLELIKNFEGFRSQKYQDTGGRWTIGFGHLIKEGENFDEGITQDQGTQLLEQDLQTTEDSINKNVRVSLTQDQFDALCSLVYNWGIGHFQRSDLLQKLNSGDYDGALQDLKNVDTVNGRVCNGLVRRRTLEANLWNGQSVVA